MDSEIFELNEKPQYDESISEIKTIDYHPIIGTNLNSDNSEINIIIENQDVFTLPSKSYLYVEGTLKDVDGTAYADANSVALIKNGIMYLFKNIRYELSGRAIENVNNPGIVGVIKGLLTYSRNFGDKNGLQMCWNLTHTKLQEYIIQKSDPKGSFSFAIPLKHIFGFCEDYGKVIYGIKHQLTMLRNQDNDAIYKTPATVKAGKVNLTKLIWMMPQIIPNDFAKLKLYKQIESKIELPIAFRQRQMDKISLPTDATTFSWRLLTTTIRPRYIVVAFQTDKDNNQDKNPSTFNHCNLFNIRAVLNSENYPGGTDLNLNFTTNKYAKAYQMMENFKQDFYGESSVCIDPIEYKTSYPLFVIDCSRQSERLKQGVIDIKLEMQFSVGVPANTMCFALVISDREVSLKSDGNKMELVI
jgi:hypothetical protein